MKVSELAAILANAPQDAAVIIESHECGHPPERVVIDDRGAVVILGDWADAYNYSDAQEVKA